MSQNVDLWQKMLNFAHSDAEAPPSVFLFHCNLIFREAGRVLKCPRLDFCFAKISIIFLISKFLALKRYKRNTVFVPKTASWKGCWNLPHLYPISEEPQEAITVIVSVT